MRLIFGCLFFIISLPLTAFEQKQGDSYRIQVNAILNNAAVLTINGKQQMLSLNEQSEEGYKLTKIATDNVTLFILGKAHSFKLGAAISSSQSSNNNAKSISLHRDANGMFRTSGKINDRPVNFLVDTDLSSLGPD